MILFQACRTQSPRSPGFERVNLEITRATSRPPTHPNTIPCLPSLSPVTRAHAGVTDKTGTHLLVVNPVSELYLHTPALSPSPAEGPGAVISPYSQLRCAGTASPIHAPRRAGDLAVATSWGSAQIPPTSPQKKLVEVMELLCPPQTQPWSTSGFRVVQNAFDISFQTPGI